MTEPKVEIRKLSEFKPLRDNPNRHTQRGLRALEDSVQEDGWVAPLTVAADGESLDGAARLEVAADKFDDEAIVVEHDGRRPIVMVRTDISDTKTEAARRIIYAANRVAQIDLDWSPEQMLADMEAGLDLSGLFEDWEIESLMTPPDEEWADAIGGLPDGDKSAFQQMTFTLHDQQVDVVLEALKASRSLGEFVDSPNENGNGNALTRICEMFLGDHGQS